MSFDWMQYNDPAGSSQAIDLATSGGNSANSDFLSLNEPAGTTADNYVISNPYISPGYKGLDVQSTLSDPSLINKLSGYAKNLYQDPNGNIDFSKVAMLLGGLYGASTYNKGLQGGEGAGYQGGIPQLYAGRNMITAPPTMINGVARRPGQGGINYGGDVTYFNTKAEVDAQKAAVDAANAAAAAKAAGSNTATTVVTNADTTAAATAKAAADKAAADAATKAAADAAAAKAKAAADAAAAAAANKTTVVGGGGNDTLVGGTGNDTLVSGTGTDTSLMSEAARLAAVAIASQKEYERLLAISNAAANAQTAAAAAAAASKAAADKLAANTSSRQQVTDINQWLLDNSGVNAASSTDISDAIKFGKLTPAELQAALAESNFSDAVKYSVLNGQGLDTLNQNIKKWVRDHPYATAKEIADAEKASGVNYTDVANAINGLEASAGKEYALVHGMGLDQFYKNILDFERGNNTPEEIAEMKRTAGIEQRDIDAAHAFAKAKGYAMGGMAKGRYLQGETDGMADELPAQIGADQPAALSHGEFVVPADVVSHLGNGNSDAGAKKLYQMMDKIRMARTGNKKQGKKINPDNFMPGGLAAAYANGGAVKHFLTGGSTTATNVNAGVTGIESNLSNWAGPYVTNMLGQGQALANMPYQAYTGPLTAGASDLQNQAFTAAGSMSTPTAMTNSATNLDTIAKAASGLNYTPDTFKNQFSAPTAYSPTTATNQFSTPTAYDATTFSSQFTAPTGIPEATNFTNQYTAPTAYSPTTSAFDQSQLQSYMNPYLDKVLDPQLAEARRQAQITQTQNAAKMTAAGAYGGGRQAILDAENQRNLGMTLSDITGKGYNTAYTNAQQQFNADQNRKMQEAQFGATQGMNAAQLQAQYGLSAQQANEMARQFGAQQKMTAAQQAAQFGQSANQATEASKQFGAQQGMTAAQQAAQFGQSAQQQNELARQFAAQQGLASAQSSAQYGQAANQANEAAKEYAANYGLQGLQTGLQAATAQGNLGAQSGQLGLQQLAQQMAAGQTQRDIESQGIAADMAQFEEARNNPFKMIQFQQSLLQGLPTSAQAYNTTGSNALSGAAQGATTIAQLIDAINGKKP